MGAASWSYWLGETLRGRGSVRERLAFLEHSQTLSRRELEAMQQEKLAELLDHAWRTVPYYRRIFDADGITPRDIQSVADLPRLPLLTRAALQANQDDLVSDAADRATLTVNYSSGSTGQRACFRQDREFRLWMRAHQLRTYAWCGHWRPGERFALLWGSEIYWSSKTLADRLFNLVSRRREMNTFRLSQEDLARFVAGLGSFDPVLISSYSNALHLVARELEMRGMRLPALRAVQSTSEPFPPAIRERVAAIFRCEVFDKYGSRETNIVSHECPTHDGMLIQTENVVVEILDEAGRPCAPGEVGRVVLTTLNNRSMPLIRYETSDLAALMPGESREGFRFPRMTAVAGRQQDLIVTPQGHYVDAYFFSYLLMRFEEIAWFQVVQHEPERLLLRIVCPRGLPPGRVGEIAERVKAHTGYPFLIDFEFLPQMPPSSTGKFRLCVSHLPAARHVRAAVEGPCPSPA